MSVYAGTTYRSHRPEPNDGNSVPSICPFWRGQPSHLGREHEFGAKSGPTTLLPYLRHACQFTLGFTPLSWKV